MAQQWRDLLFVHWAVDPELLQPTLPPRLAIDTFDGRAWLGIVPFVMCGIRPVYLPAVPGISNFLELNVRTYVRDASGRPGVWFYSLDANQWLAVQVARTFFKLPYFYAQMQLQRDGETIDYTCRRRSQKQVAQMRWQLTGDTFTAERDSLDFFLAERYLLFSYHPRKRQLYSGRVVHPPYPLRRAETQRIDTLPIQWDGLPGVQGEPAHVVASEGVDVQIYPLRRVARS